MFQSPQQRVNQWLMNNWYLPARFCRLCACSENIPLRHKECIFAILLQNWYSSMQKSKRVTNCIIEFYILCDDLYIPAYDIFHVEMVLMKATLLCVLLCLLWSLVEGQSQTEYPYISFRGNYLSNHSYVDITRVGKERFDSINNCTVSHWPGDML